ncbi:MAG: ABC transporter permease [Myxococcales bacterium]|nr:ABC transporter permease [Myxococcales bacterium]
MSGPSAADGGRVTYWRVLFVVSATLLVLALLCFAFGQAPHAVLARAFAGTWGTPYGIGQVMFKATPLLFCGLAFHVAFRAGLFNIGAEGQLALASLAAAWVASKLPASVPAVVALPATLAVAMLVGGGYAAIAGVLRARFGVHEIIAGIMLNRSADVLLPWVLAAGLGADSMRSADIAQGARLPRLDFIPGLHGSAASLAFPLAVLCTFGLYLWLDRSRAGREMRWIGQGPDACLAQGVEVPRRRIEAMCLSGAVAALGVTGTVLGYKGYYELGLGSGAGFSGIAVAMLGRAHPVALVSAALLFGTLAQAGLAVNASVPKEAMAVLEALVILLVAGSAHGDRARRARPGRAKPPAPDAPAEPSLDAPAEGAPSPGSTA